MPYSCLMLLASIPSNLPLGLIGMLGLWLTKVKGHERKT